MLVWRKQNVRSKSRAGKLGRRTIQSWELLVTEKFPPLHSGQALGSQCHVPGDGGWAVPEFSWKMLPCFCYIM